MLLRDGTEIKYNSKPYIVAELNSSHNGKIEIAKEMVLAAKKCGCNGVKFQSWTAESLYCNEYLENNPMSKRIVSRFSLDSKTLKELAEFCRENKIGFSSTPYSKDEVDVLVDECNVDYIKIASMDINNLSFLEYIAKKGVPIVLSTGMAEIEEIDTAIKCLKDNGAKNICILHCVSIYPVEAKYVNLRNMVMLKDRFPDCEVGYSDHTIGFSVACSAVALGASWIEKHFTLNNEKAGWDNQMATEPSDMKLLVDECQNVYSALGHFERTVSQEELQQRQNMRRSIVASIALSKNTILTEDMIIAKRPGTGISVSNYRDIIGKRIKNEMSSGHIIQWDELEG